MLALESQSRMTRRELLMTSISLVKDQVVFLEMRPLCPVFEHGHLAFRWGKKPAARDSKPAEMARLDRTPTLHPSSANSTDPWQQRLKPAVRAAADRPTSGTFQYQSDELIRPPWAVNLEMI